MNLKIILSRIINCRKLKIEIKCIFITRFVYFFCLNLLFECIENILKVSVIFFDIFLCLLYLYVFLFFAFMLYFNKKKFVHFFNIYFYFHIYFYFYFWFSQIFVSQEVCNGKATSCGRIYF